MSAPVGAAAMAAGGTKNGGRPSFTEPERTRIGRAARIRSTAGNFRIRAASGRASRRQQAGSRAMIDISESAQTHFRKLNEREAVPGMGRWEERGVGEEG